MTAGYNQVINRRQFGVSNLEWPLEYRYPDETYETTHDFNVGSSTFRLRHEKGETDDATVTWLHEKRVLCSGDLFIWNSPNAGNPQKVQRYPLEWAHALRRMAALQADYLLPGHGLPIFGRERITQALSETAEYLESLVEQTLALMNEGARLADTVSSVVVPRHLADRPYLQPFYDEPEFIVRNIWRLYGGWWDGNPANLRPANDRALARELAGLAGGPTGLATRAEMLLEQASDEALRLAGHLAEMAWLAAPDDEGVQRVRQRVFAALAANATSTMSRGVFRWAERESSANEG
jgi:alkyl sulfatase BDS1-like metallo-beta-lactamase superfamily hydrolase